MPISPLLADWRVLIRDASGAIKDEIDDWLTSGGGLMAEPTFNGVGAFTLSMASNGISARIIDETCGIVLVRNDVIVFSGQIRTLVRTGADITCTGLADEYLLRRPALPDPLGPPFTTPYNVVTGQASAVLRQLLFNNLSLPYCRPDRVVANLLFQTVDPALGGTITGRADGGDLLDLVATLAAVPAAGGLGVKIRQTSMTASTRTISIYQPVDRSADVQFGVDYGTASDFEDTRSAPEASMWYAMGGDGLTLDKRTVLYGSNSTLLANWGLIEKFADFRDITNPTELAAQLQSLLARSTAARKVTVTPFETTSLQFVDHWNVGDVVTFVGPDGVPFPEVIRSARIEWTERGITVTPMVGEAGATQNDLASQQLSAVTHRVDNLEQNWRVPDNSVTLAMMTANSVSTDQYVDHSVQAVHLDAIDTPANLEVPAFSSGTGRLQWLSFTELAGVTATLTNLTVTNNTILGTTSGNSLTVNAVATFNAGAVFAGTVNVAGAATLAGVTATSLSVSGTLTSNKLAVNGTTFIGSEVLHVVSGSSVLDGLVTITTGGLAVTGPATMSSTLAVTGIASANKLVLNGTTFVGSEVLRVISGSSVLEGKVTVTASGVDVTGASIFRNAVSFTSGGVDISGGLTINSGGVDVTGSSTFRASVTVTSGGIGVTGSSAFNSGVSITGGLTINTGGIVVNAAGILITAGGLTVSAGNISFPNTAIGFFGSSANSKQTVTGSRGANAALTSLLSALANYGLLTDSST